MRRLALALLLWFASSCERPRAPAPHAARPLVRVTLRQRFAVSTSHVCEAESAARALTEPAEGNPALAEDVLVAVVTLRCEDATGREVELAQALPDATIVQLVDERGGVYAPSLRTRAAEARGALVFELGADADVLPRPRRFDARTGAPLGSRERGVGHVRIALTDRIVEVSLRDAALTPALDDFLAGLAGELATDHAPAGAEGATLARLYRAAKDELGPRELALTDLARGDDGLHATLALTQSSLPGVNDPVARFDLLLAERGGAPSLARLLAPEETAERIACARAERALDARVAQAFQSAGDEPERCAVLGVLLPGSCDGPSALREEVLRTRAPCLGFPGLEPSTARLPDDFQLTLRRGRKSAGLDREPRYVLALFAEGQVVFHGRHWVSRSGRSDGRTSPALLASLLARFRALDWFDRRGGTWDPDRCGPDDEAGNVLTLHAEGRERMVVDRDGCRGPFSGRELAQLVDAIEAVSGISAWTTPPPDFADRGVEVWTVADQ